MRNNRNGTVLILALWVLTALSAFAVQTAMHIHRKIQFLSRLEKESQMRFMAEAGILKALAAYQAAKKDEESLNFKQVCFNNQAFFQEQDFGAGYYEVSYLNYDDGLQKASRMYGMVDEERKINVNKASRTVLKNIIMLTASLGEEKAEDLANAIFDWREYGRTEIVGFLSDEYYDNLEFPYPEKKGDFELMEELRLVKGMTPAIYDRLENFVTVYGDGRVNINTASGPVLAALGLSQETIGKIFMARRGIDRMEATTDDPVLADTAQIASQLTGSFRLTSSEAVQMDSLFNGKVIKEASQIFSVESWGVLPRAEEKKGIRCVFDGNNGKILFWKENII